MKSQQVVLISIVGFALLCLLGLWWLKAERPAPPVEAPPPAVHPAPPAPQPAPTPVPARPLPTPAPKPSPAPLSPPRMPTLGEKREAPRMTPLRPDWEVKDLHFAHDAPTALGAIRPLVGECFRDNGNHLRPGDQVVLQFGIAPSGHFQETDVVSPVQDPYLQACLEDALHDASTTGGGAKDPVKYVFTYQADGGTTAEPAP